jgi:hypothetical protein
VELRVLIVACWNLEDAERRAALLREGEQLRGASLVNLAVWDGPKLTRAWEQYHDKLATSPGAADDNSAVIAEALAHIALQRS